MTSLLFSRFSNRSQLAAKHTKDRTKMLLKPYCFFANPGTTHGNIRASHLGIPEKFYEGDKTRIISSLYKEKWYL
jgi:hypothetical protein